MAGTVIAVETNLPSVIERLDTMAAQAEAETTAMLERGAVAVREVYLSSLIRATPVATGLTAESSEGEIALSPEGAVITFRQTRTVPWRGHGDYPVARFLIEGTEPHDIYPINARALFWEGAAHPVSHVHHPGFPGRDYPGEAMDEAMPAIDVTLAAEAAAVARMVVRSLAA